MKNHGGHYACGSCEVKGVFNKISKSVSYNKLNCPKRTDASFRTQKQPQHHVGNSPLLDLNIDMIDTFSYDYMHLVVSGVVRKLVKTWAHGTKNALQYKLSSNQKSTVEANIKVAHSYMPCDFNRKPRTLVDVDLFKATEFRSILLYTGMFIFRKALPKKLYEHLILLSFLCRILCDETMIAHEENLVFANRLSYSFVKHYEKLYSRLTLSYNVHCLIHIVDDVKRLGCLDNFSAFAYESMLGNMGKRVRSPYKPFVQLCNRISEGYAFNREKVIKANEIHIHGKRLIPGKLKDASVLLNDDEFGYISNVANDDCVHIQMYRIIEPFITKPIKSSMFKIYKVSLSDVKKIITFERILRKCVVFPMGTNFFYLSASVECSGQFCVQL